MTSKKSDKQDFNLSNNINFFLFTCCSTREDLSIHVPFTTVRLILTNLGMISAQVKIQAKIQFRPSLK